MKKISNSKPFGFTLVELMVAVLLSGVVSLAVMQFIIDFMTQDQQTRSEADAASDTQLFVRSLEQYISQTTLVVACGCNADPMPGAGCRNEGLALEAKPWDSQNPINTTSLLFVTEDAIDPLRDSTAEGGCIGLVSNRAVRPIPGTNIVARGCKKLMALRYVPVSNPPGRPQGLPPLHRLELVMTRQGQPPLTLLALNNVTAFGCGMTSLNSTNLSNLDFRMRIETLTGHHRRSQYTQIGFRNLGMPGIHFGKVRTIPNCIENFQPSSSRAQCCSGYWNAVNHRCISRNDCGTNTTSYQSFIPIRNIGPDCCSLQEAADRTCI